jgi:hypothetical protein
MSTPTSIRAVLDVSVGCFEELKARFEACSAPVFDTYEGKEIIKFGSLALRRENDDNVKCYLVYQGKIVKTKEIELDRPEPDEPFRTNAELASPEATDSAQEIQGSTSGNDERPIAP